MWTAPSSCIRRRDRGTRNNLGQLLYMRRDVDGSEKALRAAIKVDPGCARAHHNLGVLLQYERQEAFRTAAGRLLPW